MKFKTIEDYPRYSVSECGKIMNNKTGRILKPWISHKGYEVIRLKPSNINQKVHRLVAKTWIDNSYSLEIVNHKDGNRRNNNVTNLEWCSQKDNIIHRFGRPNGLGITKEKVLEVYKKGIWNNAEELIIAIMAM